MSVDINFDFDAALAKLNELAVEHGPQAIDLAVRVKQAESIGQIAVGLAVAAATVGIGVATYKLTIKALQSLQTDSLREAWQDHKRYPSLYKEPAFPHPEPTITPVWMTGAIVSGILAVTFCINAAASLFDKWAWIGAFAPELALANDVMQKVLGS